MNKLSIGVILLVLASAGPILSAENDTSAENEGGIPLDDPAGDGTSTLRQRWGRRFSLPPFLCKIFGNFGPFCQGNETSGDGMPPFNGTHFGGGRRPGFGGPLRGMMNMFRNWQRPHNETFDGEGKPPFNGTRFGGGRRSGFGGPFRRLIRFILRSFLGVFRRDFSRDATTTPPTA